MSRERPGKMCDQLGNVLAPFRERGHPDGKHVKTVVQIFPKAPSEYRCFQITVRGRDYPEIRDLRFRGADSLETPLFQNAQKGHLHFDWHVANLIEKQSASRCGLKLADTRLMCAGERAAFVPK